MKILMVLAPRDFRDEEFIEPFRALDYAGHEVTVVSTEVGACVGVRGATIEVTQTLRDVEPADYDGAVFVGGPGARALFDDEDAQALAVTLEREGKVLAAICGAPAILARAGVLEGRRATIIDTNLDDLREGGAVYEDAEVVVDGRIVTGQRPESARAFGAALVELLRHEREVYEAAAP